MRKYFLIFMGLLVFFLLYSLGWVTSPVGWEKATGWKNIPDALKPLKLEKTDSEPAIFWLGHAGFLIHWNKKNILIDPNLSDHTLFVKRHMTLPLLASDLPPIDAVLISHAHFDHLDNPTIDQIKELKSIVVPFGSEEYLTQEKSLKREIIPLQVDESFSLGDIKITAVKAIHSGSRYHPWPGRHFAVGYIIESQGVALYISGDTAFGPHFAEIKKKFHPDLALLPIGGYSPRFLLKYHHLNPADTVAAAKALGIKKVIPGHMGTFRVAFDRPETALLTFARLSKAQSLPWAMPVLLTNKKITEGVLK